MMIYLNKDFIKRYNEESGEEYFLEFDVQYLEKSYDPHISFCLKVEKVAKSKHICYAHKFKTMIKSCITYEKVAWNL